MRIVDMGQEMARLCYHFDNAMEFQSDLGAAAIRFCPTRDA
jgi:hypothetical protein